MNKFYWVWIVLLLTCYKSYSQGAVAVITDVQQEIKLYPSLRSILSEQSFPDYFTQDSLWQQSILQDLQEQISKKIDVKEIYVQDAFAGIQFIKSSTPLSPRLKLAGTSRTSAGYFVALTNTIALTTTAIEESGLPVRHYHYVSEIKIEDKLGKSVFKNKITIPFRTAIKPENGLYGDTEISEKDFKDLFRQSITAVFDDKVKRLPARTFYRPLFNEPRYQPFLAKAKIYTLQELAPNIPVQRGQPHHRQYFYKGHADRKAYNINLSQVYTGSVQSPDNTYSCRVDLSEDITRSDYQLWMQLNRLAAPGDATGGSIYAQKAEVRIRCMSGGLLAGDFVLNARKMEGMVGYQVYTLNRIITKNTFELVANNKLLALIQMAGTGKAGDTPTQDYVWYISKEVNIEQQGELTTIFLMYKLAAEFGKDFL